MIDCVIFRICPVGEFRIGTMFMSCEVKKTEVSMSVIPRTSSVASRNIMPKEVLLLSTGRHLNLSMPRCAKTKTTPKDAKIISKPHKVADSSSCDCATF